MSGGMFGGDAWTKNHEGILDHARDLHYDHVPGITLPAADASKETWTTAMDAFNDWKARERAKEAAGQAWWQTYKGGDGGTPPSGGTPPGGGTGPPDWDKPDPPTGTGPYPDSNIYFPMLVPEYNDPKAQDWSQYMPQGQSGLLYQPWSQEYGEQFVQPNIWDYQPPELKVGRPKYYQNPLGIMDVTEYVPPSESTTNPNDDLENRGGPDPNYDNDPNRPPQSGFIIGADGKGYAVDENGMVIGPSGYPSIDLTATHNPQTNNPTLADLLAGLGLGSGGTSGGTSGGSGNSPGPGGPAGGGHSNK